MEIRQPVWEDGTKGYEMTRSRIYPLLAAALLLSGCASVEDVQDYTGTLKPGDGVVAVVVDTMVPFANLRLIRPQDAVAAIAARDLPKGRTVRFVEVPAGEYQWARVDLSSYGYYLMLDKNEKQRYTFTVKPGVINYPGDLVISVEVKQLVLRNRYYWPSTRYYVQQVDRNAMLLDDLTPEQAAMVDRLNLVYVGPGTDDFESYYRSILTSHKVSP